MNTPIFLAIEGPNGAGKSTLVAGLRRLFQEGGCEVVCTFEPGDTEFGAHMRTGCKTVRGVNDFAVALAMNASRAEKAAKVVLPALAQGRVVITDRWCDSTRVFQDELGHLTSAERAVVESVHALLPLPDFTVFLIPSVDLLNERAEKRSREGSEVDVFEMGSEREWRAYENVYAAAVLRAPALALRFGPGTEDGLLHRVMNDPGFASLMERRGIPYLSLHDNFADSGAHR